MKVADRIEERRLYNWAMSEHARRMALIEKPTQLDELRVIYEISSEMLRARPYGTAGKAK